MAITLTQLRSFLAVCKTGSVTGAADELFVTQPSVSAAVSALSRELGVELTERVGRNIRPTSAGAAFAPYAADVIGLLGQGGQAAREAADSSARALRIAAVTTAGEHIVPPLVEAFLSLHPEVRLSVEVGNRQRVFDRLRSHRSDLAIGGRPPGEGVVGEPFLDNPIVIISSPDDPLAGREKVSAEELGAHPWLAREEGSGTRTMTEDFLATHDMAPALLTLGSNGAIKQAARAGLGISLQARLAAQLELDLGLLATVEPEVELPHRQWYVLRPEHGPAREPVEAFAEFVHKEGAALVRRAAGAGPSAQIRRKTGPG